MEELTNLSLEAINRYFKSLSVFGYKSYNEVEKLIILLFLEEVLSGELAFFVTEEDYKIITKSIYCLAGSNCMIDYPLFHVFDDLIHKSRLSFIPRITEDSNLRATDISLRNKA